MERALVIGTSGGIGGALAADLARRGVEVTGLSRFGAGLELSDAEAVERVMAAVEGPFDWVLIATGLLAPEGAQPEKSLAAIDADAMARVIAVNAIGPALILRHAARLLPRAGRSRLGILSARVGSIGDNRLGGWHSYRASKAALNQIVRGAAVELARTHPDAVVAALHPGTVDTRFTSAFGARDKLAPDVAAERLLAVLGGLGPDQTGRFWDHAGAEVPW